MKLDYEYEAPSKLYTFYLENKNGILALIIFLGFIIGSSLTK